MPADWQEIRIGAGNKESVEIPVPVDSLVCPPGRVRKADGTKFKGDERPKFDVVDTGMGTGSKIVLADAVAEEVVFQYKEDSD